MQIDMNRSFYFSFFLFLISASLVGQVTFERNIDWMEVLKKAKKEKKLIFLQLESKECLQCNEVATQGFGSTMLKEKFSVNFVSIRLDVDSPEGKALAIKYDVRGFPISLFLNAEGDLLHAYRGSTNASTTYMQHADMALTKRNEKPLSYYEKEFQQGNRNAEFLEAYIKKRKATSLSVQDLLDVYIGILPLDSLTNFRIAKFIYSQGPSLDSRAYKAVRAVSGQKLVDSIYKSIPLTEAVNMNNQIIGATLQSAIAKKNTTLAYELSNFVRGTYGKEWAKGQKAATNNLLKYFYAVKDTQNYIQTAVRFFDENHMRTSIDSLKRLDEAEMKKQMKTMTDQMKNRRGVAPSEMMSREMFGIRPPSQFYHIELNQAAWYFWELTSDYNHLEKALMWSKRSMELHDELNRDKNTPFAKGNPSYIDTYAHLLYKLGRKEEAITWQTKAIEIAKIAEQPYSSMEVSLEKMKNGKL